MVAEAAQEYPAAAHKPEQFVGYDKLLDAIKSNALQVDLVVLTTPSGLHPAQTIAAAKVGVHVCTEKPMATRWEDGVAMVKLVIKQVPFVCRERIVNSTAVG